MTDRRPSPTENVKVFIRIRPLQPTETSSNLTIHSDDSVTINSPKEPKTFSFSKIFDEKSTQLDVYQTVASPLVNQALNGYNGTILAYGQSGTGKTFTILGDNKSTDLRGIVPNVFSHILSQIALSDSSTSYLLTVTFLEIYNEEVRDLLSYTGKKLEVRESPEYGVYVKNLSGVTVESTEQVFDIISKGLKNRALACTSLNTQSSRSHAIFTILIEAKHEDQSTTYAKLNLVDLAGSERASKSMASGDRLKEASKINLSLSVLGNVISALVDNPNSHIPYRNSKLTRLLQDSLGGSCLTSMIATVSPCMEHLEETCFTLMYAVRARKIKNVIKRNEENLSVLRSFEEKIKTLQKQLNELERGQLVKKKTNNKERDMELEAVKNQKGELLAKLSQLQKKVLIGGENLLEKAEIQRELLNFSAKELRMLDSSHQLLQESLEEKKLQKHLFERKSLSLQEEDKLLDFHLKETQKKLNKAKTLLYNKEAEYQNEISSLLYTNKCLAKDMGLAHYIISKTIPQEHLGTIQESVYYDEESQEFRLKFIAHCGNNLKKISLGHVEASRVGSNAMRRRYRKYPNEK
ncbi:kinesin-like protein klp-20 [Anthonomus grandis grandis]|uniref:kinesin-like protein klp-20 n=1 Tax=Anthonomus grandis grandis TaxID=2921223 RepID=UPI0021653B2A|nr:kinesin-like protein klp-20 [Anthonomus grandis grandis]